MNSRLVLSWGLGLSSILPSWISVCLVLSRLWVFTTPSTRTITTSFPSLCRLLQLLPIVIASLPLLAVPMPSLTLTVKTRLKQWAQVVACSVRQSSR
ncbi:hypothetical protein Gorai_023937 [Gossypium raimondii]|uniref:Uncharacterized protein n=1 Tax=Gossypium raimondii TaxID=29730 RepID=A0A7J8NXY4_GOSRA|nr:hypothetical protein [Gossypium raimondii]